MSASDADTWGPHDQEVPDDFELSDALAENATLRARLVHLEADVTEHDALVDRLRRENLRVFDRLREKCRHCADSADILG